MSIGPDGDLFERSRHSRIARMPTKIGVISGMADLRVKCRTDLDVMDELVGAVAGWASLLPEDA